MKKSIYQFLLCSVSLLSSTGLMAGSSLPGAGVPEEQETAPTSAPEETTNDAGTPTASPSMLSQLGSQFSNLSNSAQTAIAATGTAGLIGGGVVGGLGILWGIKAIVNNRKSAAAVSKRIEDLKKLKVTPEAYKQAVEDLNKSNNELKVLVGGILAEDLTAKDLQQFPGEDDDAKRNNQQKEIEAQDLIKDTLHSAGLLEADGKTLKQEAVKGNGIAKAISGISTDLTNYAQKAKDIKAVADAKIRAKKALRATDLKLLNKEAQLEADSHPRPALYEKGRGWGEASKKVPLAVADKLGVWRDGPSLEARQEVRATQKILKSSGEPARASSARHQIIGPK